jgi:hypothetical protein
MSFRLGFYAASFLGLGAISWSACSLNPQPLPPPELSAVPKTPDAGAVGDNGRYDASASGDSATFSEGDSAAPPDKGDAASDGATDAAADAQDAARD